MINNNINNNNNIIIFIIIINYSNNGLNYIFQTKNSAEWRNLFDAIIVKNKIK